MKAASDGAGPRRWLTASALLLAGALACGDDPTTPVPSCDPETGLPFGRTMVHSLAEDDLVLDRAPVDYFSVRLQAGGRLVVDMSSSAVDPFLLIWDSARPKPLAQAFDPTGHGPVRTAVLEMTLPRGCYLIAATAWDPDARGEYTVRVDFSPGA